LIAVLSCLKIQKDKKKEKNMKKRRKENARGDQGGRRF